jgi:hypothetical protein
VWAAQVFAPERGRLAPYDRKTLVDGLEEQLDVAHRVLAHIPREPVDPVVIGSGREECQRQGALCHARQEPLKTVLYMAVDSRKNKGLTPLYISRPASPSGWWLYIGYRNSARDLECSGVL